MTGGTRVNMDMVRCIRMGTNRRTSMSLDMVGGNRISINTLLLVLM